MLVDIDVWRLAEAVASLVDNALGKVQNFCTRAIVFSQENMLRVIFFVEVEEVGSIGALEAVNGLIVVAHGHDIWLTFIARVISEERNQLHLRIVSVLIFIQQDVLETFLGVVANFVVIFEQVDGGENHIVVIKETFEL